MSNITWTNPPASTRGRNPWRKPIVKELGERPGDWALVESGLTNSTAEAWKRLGCEATSRSRKDDDGNTLFDVYARIPLAAGEEELEVDDEEEGDEELALMREYS